MSVDRRLSWTAQYQADIAGVDQSFADAATKFVCLMDRPLENSPDIKVKREDKVDMGSSAPFRRRLEIVMNATSVEVVTAPDEMIRLFVDLGMETGDDLNIEVMAARSDERANPRKHAENDYSVTLMPTTYRPGLFGIKFNYAHQLWLLKSGTPVDQTESPSPLSDRYFELTRTFDLMREGLVYDSYDEGTHAAVTRYRQKPHPYLAAMHRGTADWMTTLVDSRLAA